MVQVHGYIRTLPNPLSYPRPYDIQEHRRLKNNRLLKQNNEFLRNPRRNDPALNRVPLKFRNIDRRTRGFVHLPYVFYNFAQGRRTEQERAGPLNVRYHPLANPGAGQQLMHPHAGVRL